MGQNAAVTTVRGVVLQASYRIVSRQGGERVSVVYIYGKLEEGGTFLIRDDRQRPHFYIRASDAQRARKVSKDERGQQRRAPVVRVA